MSMSISQLTRIEKIVLKKLSLEGPSSGYDFHLGGKTRLGRKRLMSPGHWETIKKKLGPDGKNLIEVLKGDIVREEWLSNKVDDIVRGRGYEKKKKTVKKLYWLTDGGFNEAIKLGIPSKRLFFWIEKIYKNSFDKVQFFRDLATELGEVRLRKCAKHMIWENGELTFETIPLGKDSEKYVKAMIKASRKNPRYSQLIRKKLNEVRNALNELDEELK